MLVAGQADLLEVVGALDAAGGLAHLLHRRQEQPDQHRDDADHHQQLDQREGIPAAPAGVCDAGHELNPPLAERPPYFLCSPAPGAGAFGSGGARQIFTVPSRLAEAIHLPSELKDTPCTQLVCPRSVWAGWPGPSQTVTVPSVLPQARRDPSRSNATQWTQPLGWGRSCSSRHDAASQTLTVRSQLAEASRLPSRLYVTLATRPAC